LEVEVDGGQEVNSMQELETTFTGTFERSMGIPCHQSLINLSIKIKSEHFRVFWRFERPSCAAT
jgi:hypothetical protein